MPKTGHCRNGCRNEHDPDWLVTGLLGSLNEHGHVPVTCLTLATYLPYLLLPTERNVLSRELRTKKMQHAVVHTDSNLQVSIFCVAQARREFETPALGQS